MITIEFIPYSEIEGLSSIGRIRKLLKIAKENKIVLLEGRLRKEEEAELIKTTMEEIDDEFKGIELGVIYPEEGQLNFIKKLRLNIVNIVLGYRAGFTVIGPASVVKEIKKDPKRIELFTIDKQKTRKLKKKK
ncbi:MAG: OapB/ArvB family protein [Candidatus Woesearchaeota archaeon]